MHADTLPCECTVAQQKQQQKQQKQQEIVNVEKQEQQKLQWSATEACRVTKNNNNNNTIEQCSNSSSNGGGDDDDDGSRSSRTIASRCRNWHAICAQQQQRRSSIMHGKNKQQQRRTNYCNFNKINRLLIAIVGLFLITITTTTTTTATTTMMIVVTAAAAAAATAKTKTKTKRMTIPTLCVLLIPTSLMMAPMNYGAIGVTAAAAAAAAVPASSPLSALQQQRQLQQQQLFAMLTKNHQSSNSAGDAITAGGGGGGGGVSGSGVDQGEGVAASALAAGGFVPKHLLDLDGLAPGDDNTDDTSLETAGFVADDGQRYEKAVKALAASANSNNNNNKAGAMHNDSNGGVGRLYGVGAAPTDCPKECKCLDAYFDCGDKLLDRVPTLPSYVQTLDLVGNRLNNTSVLQIRNLTELIKLTLKRNQLDSVPVFIELSSLKQLNLANNRIQRISSEALEALPKLKSLDLSRNLLHTVELNYFPANNRLAHLILNSNEISSIDEDAFQHLGDLLDLELNNNRLQSLPAGVFRTLHKLRKLTLNNNQLEINWSTFRGLSSLQKLFLKSNNIRALQDGVFYVMHAIETIELDHNGITSLSRQGLFNLTKLHHLSLSNNSISRIEPDTWEFTQSLISLDLSHNNISEFKPQHLDCLKRLRHLNLGHNKIQYLADNTFDCVKNLEDLNLRRNKLAWIIEDHGATPAFKALRKLKKLDLYGNNLKQIMSKSLSGLSNLESLNLGGNALATIQTGAFDHMPHLQKLSFKSMNFICDCELVWFQRWLRRNEQSSSGTQVQSENAVCGYPEELFDRQLLTLNANDLACANSPKPTIVQEPSSQLTVKGANITMECIGISPTAASLAAADELKIKWRHDNQNIRERDGRGGSHFYTTTHSSDLGAATAANGGGGESYSTTETRILHDQATNQTTILGYLRLYNVSYANAGRYQCVISNAFGTTYSQRFKISIGIHPTFLQVPSNLTIDSGDTARLVCSATGDPVPEIALQKFGGSDFPAATERRLQVIREENAFIITNAKPIDTGIYTCTAESAAGEIKVNATLIVNDKPQPNIPIVKKETVVGESSVLQCLSDFAADLSQPHREWYKDNKPFHLGTLSADTERYFFTGEHELLVIVNTQSADAGHYRCEISDNSKTYTVQTELIVVKEELSQNVIFFGVVIVAALCVLIIALVGFALLLHQRRKAYQRRRREACQNANSTSGAPSGLLTGSMGLIGAGGGGVVGSARVGSTSTQLLNASRASSALDQTQITTLNRTLRPKRPPADAQRQRPHSIGDYEMNMGKNECLNGDADDDSDAYDIDRQHPKHLIITKTPNYEQLMQQRAENEANVCGVGGGTSEPLSLSYLKHTSLPDNTGPTVGISAGDHNQQDHLSSKDSGTGSDTAVKHSIDDFTLTGAATTPVNDESTPQLMRRYNGYQYGGPYTSAEDCAVDLDNADLLYAATHALGVSECDVELLDFDRHRASTMRINDKDMILGGGGGERLGNEETEIEADANADEAPNERTHFLNYSSYNYDKNNGNTNDRRRRSGGGVGGISNYERPTTKLQYNNYISGGGGGGNGVGTNSFIDSGKSGGSGARGAVSIDKASSNPLSALGGNCKANLSTNSTNAAAAHAQTVDI